MEYANRIAISGGKRVLELVKMTDLVKEDWDEIRSSEYQCPDTERCAVSVFPALPEKVKTNRRKAPRPYFRAGRKNPHTDNCRRDGVCVASSEVSRSAGTLQNVENRDSVGKDDARPAIVVSKTGDIPHRFLESREKRDNPLGDNGESSDLSPGLNRPWSGQGGNEDGNWKRHVSETAVRHVVDLVKVYESHPKEFLQNEPLRILGCPGKTYWHAFVDISLALEKRNGRLPEARHIYFGTYSHHVDHYSGIAVFFKNLTHNDKPISIWIPNELGPQDIRSVIEENLDIARRGAPAIVYALGRFSLAVRGTKFSIELTSLSQAWISAYHPADEQLQAP